MVEWKAGCVDEVIREKGKGWIFFNRRRMDDWVWDMSVRAKVAEVSNDI